MRYFFDILVTKASVPSNPKSKETPSFVNQIPSLPLVENRKARLASVEIETPIAKTSLDNSEQLSSANHASTSTLTVKPSQQSQAENNTLLKLASTNSQFEVENLSLSATLAEKKIQQQSKPFIPITSGIATGSQNKNITIKPITKLPTASSSINTCTVQPIPSTNEINNSPITSYSMNDDNTPYTLSPSTSSMLSSPVSEFKFHAIVEAKRQFAAYCEWNHLIEVNDRKNGIVTPVNRSQHMKQIKKLINNKIPQFFTDFKVDKSVLEKGFWPATLNKNSYLVFELTQGRSESGILNSSQWINSTDNVPLSDEKVFKTMSETLEKEKGFIRFLIPKCNDVDTSFITDFFLVYLKAKKNNE